MRAQLRSPALLDQLLDHLQVELGLMKTPRKSQGTNQGHQQWRMLLQLLIRQNTEPFANQLETAASYPGAASLFKHTDEQSLISRGLSLLQGRLNVALAQVILSRTATEQQHGCRTLDAQTCPEKILQQGVIAIGTRALLDRQHEQMLLSQLLQQKRRTAALQHVVAQRTIELIEQRRAKEKLAQLRRQLLEHHLAEVIDDFRLSAAKALQRGDAIAGKSQQRDLDPRHPALGHALQAAQVIITQRWATEVTIELLDLIGRQAQVMLIDTQQAVLQLQPGQGKTRMFARGDQQPHVVRQAVEQGRQSVDNHPIGQVMEIVKHQLQVATDTFQCLGQQLAGHHRRTRKLGADGVKPGGIEVADLLTDGGQQAAKEAYRLVVAGLKIQQYMAGTGFALQPLRQQRALARASRRQHQGQGITFTVTEQLQQTWTQHAQRHRQRGDSAVHTTGLVRALFLFL